MSKTDVERNLKAAKDAVDFTRQILFIGMGNFMNDPKDPRFLRRLEYGKAIGLSLSLGNPVFGWLGEQIAKYGPEVALISLRLSMLPQELCSALAGIYAKKSGNTEMLRAANQSDIKNTARSAIDLGVGNCAEHACLCYMALLNNVPKPRPLEVLLTQDHAFCSIGRPDSKSPDPADWGDETIVVDAYYGEYYLLQDGKLRQHQQGVKFSKGRIEV